VKTFWRSRPALGWVLLFVPVVVLFYWKIVLTGQFSLLTSAEGVNQAYSWTQYWIVGIRHGILPLWDPYVSAGHSFAGEMQTGAFNPLHLLLALVPFNNAGVFSPRLFHFWSAGMHVLAACFMFALARELGVSRFAAFIAGICFSLGGFVARAGWPDMLETALWLPLVFLFLIRALRSEGARAVVWNAALGGLALGMAILSGGLHVVIMDALAVVSAGIYYLCAARPKQAAAERAGWGGFRLRTAGAVAVLVCVGLAAGAVQLLPSFEYSKGALRFLGQPGALPATQKIPYAYLLDQWLPHGISVLAMPFAFNGNAGQGETVSPYIGFFPFLAAVIGIRRYWGTLWVRYLAGLAVAALLYTMGSFSLLHGVLYAVVPQLWMMREAPRMAYLLDFALAILAAFGVEALISAGRAKASWPGLDRVFLWAVVACAAVLFVPAVFGKPDINPWNTLSILVILASYGLFRYMENGNRGRASRTIMVLLILFDLSACTWEPRNLIETTRSGVDHLTRILSARGAAQFLKSRPGPFRVRVLADPVPNIGDLFGVPMADPSHGATLPIDYTRIMGYTDLLNVRYFLTPATEKKPGAVYEDGAWKVYENPAGYPRAWIVHEATVERDARRAAEAPSTPGFNPRRTALVDGAVTLDPAIADAQETVGFSAIEPNRIQMDVLADSRGLLVLSENYYPGWRATVRGRDARIYRVDGALRGVAVPQGLSRVILDYSPASVYWGGALTLAAFLGTAAFGFYLRRARRKASRPA